MEDHSSGKRTEKKKNIPPVSTPLKEPDSPQHFDDLPICNLSNITDNPAPKLSDDIGQKTSKTSDKSAKRGLFVGRIRRKKNKPELHVLGVRPLKTPLLTLQKKETAFGPPELSPDCDTSQASRVPRNVKRFQDDRVTNKILQPKERSPSNHLNSNLEIPTTSATADNFEPPTKNIPLKSPTATDGPRQKPTVAQDMYSLSQRRKKSPSIFKDKSLNQETLKKLEKSLESSEYFMNRLEARQTMEEEHMEECMKRLWEDQQYFRLKFPKIYAHLVKNNEWLSCI